MTDAAPTTAPELEKKIWQLMKAGKLEDAAALCDQLNQAFPDYGPGWNTSSRLAIGMNEPVIALMAVQRALLLSPGKPEWLLQKMASLAVYGDLQATNIIADEIAQHVFETAYHASTCAVTMNLLERYSDAERHFLRAVELNPHNANYRINLATAQRFLGNSAAAAESLDRAIDLNPTDSEAQLLRSGFKTYSESDNNIESLRAALDKMPPQHPGRVQLFYALAKELNDMQHYEESFEELRKGTAARRTKLNYETSKDLDSMRTIRELFDKDVYDSITLGFVNAEPIFVIGMPRSGTALVERVLNNHSVVRSVGEPQSFGIELVNECERVSGAMPSDAAELMTAAQKIDYAALGEAYVKTARPASGVIAHFVDKLPINFMYAGLIHLALPKAKIILVERDPMDNCYTAFKALFSGAYPYSYDLEELANYFVAYSKLMDYWRAVMPGVIHSISYEDLVTNSKTAIENLLEYCNLSFEEQCLDFYSQAEKAATASVVRLRHEIRAKSIGDWRHYSEQLEPVTDILEKGGVPVSA
jgi:tetratricopeptide (TPR) repeat protein